MRPKHERSHGFKTQRGVPRERGKKLGHLTNGARLRAMRSQSGEGGGKVCCGGVWNVLCEKFFPGLQKRDDEGVVIGQANTEPQH